MSVATAVKHYFYSLDFGYHGHNWEEVKKIRRNPDVELDHGSFFLIAAEEYVAKLAEKAGIEMQHAYSWPDGSCYKYVRSQHQISHQELCAFFEGTEPHTLTTQDGTKYPVSVYLRDAKEEDGDKIHITDYLSLRERWTLSREERHKLYMDRHQLREKCFSDYRQHRDTCDQCPKPYGLPCDAGLKLCKQAEKAADKLVASFGK